jgi:glycosyltransferase involved in cell wall biosynthesis
MKVLFQQQHDFNERIGGAETQFGAFVRYTTSCGVETEVSLKNDPDVSEFDLVHVFNTCNFNDSIAQMENARIQGKPVFLSTIYWNWKEAYDERIKFDEEHNIGWCGQREKVNGMAGIQQRIGRLIDTADVLLPASYAEYGVLSADAFPGRYRLQPWFVVPNGFDPIMSGGSAEEFISKYNLHDFVLVVGRIDLHKNGLNIAKAMAGLDIPLVFIGDKEDQYFADIIEKESGPNTYFLGKMNPGQLKHAYAAARVLVQASLFEIPGLAALEGAAAGCAVVVSNRGSIREYLGNLAEYCNPVDPLSIKRAIIRAYESGPDKNLKLHVFKNFTWDNVVSKNLLNAYKEGLRILRNS